MSRVNWLLLIASMLAGCRSQPGAGTESDPFAVAPMDFSLDVTVLPGESVVERADAAARPSRYVLFPDGSLHYGTGDKVGPDQLPPLVRRLNRRQVAAVWSRARQIGFADPGNGSEPTNFSLIDPGGQEIVHLLRFTGDGDRWEFVRRSSIESPDAASTRMLGDLARLAWASEDADRESIIPPRRYDYGPDPYAAYRE